MNKAAYRQVYKQKRLSLSEAERRMFDEAMLFKLTTLDWTAIRYVHVYISILKFNEPDTLRFVTYLREVHPEIKIVLSKTNFQTCAMTHYLWDADLVLEANNWGILEPKDGVLVADVAIDLVIVPLLVADQQGNRVGYGKGFYDRFLAKCRAGVKKVGLSYFEPVVAIADVDPLDIPLTLLITPTREYIFSS